MGQRNFKLEQAIEFVDNLDLSVEDNRLIKYYVDYLKGDIRQYRAELSEYEECFKLIGRLIPPNNKHTVYK